jgi:hypothetical protein
LLQETADSFSLSSDTYRPNFEFLAQYLIHSLDSGDFSVSAKKKLTQKNQIIMYGIREHILEEMYADLNEITGIHKPLWSVVSCVREGRLVQWYVRSLEK